MTPAPRVALCLSSVLLGLAWPTLSQADDLERGLARFQAADFEGCLIAFEEAEAGDALSREGFVELLRTRALVHLALGNGQALEADLEALATVAPEVELGPEAPPEIRERLRALAGPGLAVQGAARRRGPQVEFSAWVSSDRAGLTRHVHVHVRVAGQREFTRHVTPAILEDVPVAQDVFYYVEVVGPGGAVLARHGSRDAPLRLSALPPPALPTRASRGLADAPPVVPGEVDRVRRRRAWIGGVAAAVAVIAGGVAAAFLLGGGDRTPLP